MSKNLNNEQLAPAPIAETAAVPSVPSKAEAVDAAADEHDVLLQQALADDEQGDGGALGSSGDYAVAAHGQDVKKGDAAAQNDAAVTVPLPWTYERMFRAWHKEPSAADDEAARKRRKRSSLIAAIGDGISALSNVYTAGRYGTPNMRDGNNNMSAKLRAQWDTEDENRRAGREKFLTGLMHARQLDRAEAAAELSRRNEAQKTATEKALKEREMQLKEEKSRADVALKQAQELRYQAMYETDQARKNLLLRQASMLERRFAETVRHNRTTEGIAQTRAANSSTNSSGSGRKGMEDYSIDETYTYDDFGRRTGHTTTRTVRRADGTTSTTTTQRGVGTGTGSSTSGSKYANVKKLGW